MNALEWIILVILMFSALVAAAQGLFFEIISLAGAITGYLLAAWGCGTIAPWFLPYVKSQPFAELAGFLSIFFAIVVLAGAIARIVAWMVYASGFRLAGRRLRAAFCFLRRAVTVSARPLAVKSSVPAHPLLSRSLPARSLF